MMLLVNTTDKIRATLSAAVTVDVLSHYIDASNNASPPVVQDPMGRLLTALSSTTTTDIVAAPASNEVRNVKEITARNRSAGTPVDITITYDANGTIIEIIKATLQPGDTLQYIQGIGWFVFTPGKLLANKRVATDVANATTSFADVTGLTVPVKSGKHYNFEAHLFHIENAATTGARWGVNGPAMTAMRLFGLGMYTGSLTAATMQGNTADVAALDTAVPGVTTASPATPQVALMILTGWINPSADGTFAVRFQSEVAVAAGVTVKAGSWLQLWESDS